MSRQRVVKSGAPIVERTTYRPGRAATGSMTVGHPLLQLQKTLGNQVVQRLFSLEGRRPLGAAVERLLQDKVATRKMPGGLRPAAHASKHPGGIASPLRSRLEALSGMDLSSVRVHTNSPKPALAGALAYTEGQDIHIAPGQDRNLPHEAWHVVQQMQGRVKPTLRTNSMLINDDARLEREADVMGARAWPTRSGERAETDSIHPRSLTRVLTRPGFAASVSPAVLQRQVRTSGGEWSTGLYRPVDERDFPGALPGLRGVRAQIRFNPADNVNAEVIGLTQSVQAFVNGRPSFAASDEIGPTRAIPSASAIRTTAGPGQTDEGTQIDKPPRFNNPIYPVKSTSSTSLGDPDLDEQRWGMNGGHFRDANGQVQHQMAILNDTPMREGAAQNSWMVLETAALALRGDQTGTYYGSVRWGWQTDSSGVYTTIPLAKGSDGVPSSTFMKAAELWNASTSSTGAATIDLPIVDVKVTTAPISRAQPPGADYKVAPLTIPAGTRVQVLQEPTPPNVNGVIAIVDGLASLIGEALEVAPADMSKMKDERP